MLEQKGEGRKERTAGLCRNDLYDGALALKKLGNETGRLHVIQMDVINQEEVDASLAYVESNLPELGLWGLVNNSGVSCVGFADVNALPVENYKQVHSFNSH